MKNKKLVSRQKTFNVKPRLTDHHTGKVIKDGRVESVVVVRERVGLWEGGKQA